MLDRMMINGEEVTFGAIMVRIGMNAHKLRTDFSHLLEDSKSLYETAAVSRVGQHTNYPRRAGYEIQNINAALYWARLSVAEKEEMLCLYDITYHR